MSRVKPALDELEDLAAHSVQPFVRALERLARLHAREELTRKVNPAERAAALANLERLWAETMALADIYGRRRLLLEVQAAGPQPEGLPRVLFAETPVVPHVPFDEVARQIFQRWPQLADPRSQVPRWRQIADLYQTKHVFGMARSFDLNLTKKIQEILLRSQERGEPVMTTEKVIGELGGWSQAYAETVYRTNLNTAYTAGRFNQAQDPDVAFALGAFEYEAVRDSDCRPNHEALHGLLAHQDDPLWDRYAPPNGYNCRCSVRVVTKAELKQRGLIRGAKVQTVYPAHFSEGGPDPAFEAKRHRMRPDKLFYG
jgi:SPP1 gp7 family putative phage head morphogenesis protein